MQKYCWFQECILTHVCQLRQVKTMPAQDAGFTGPGLPALISLQSSKAQGESRDAGHDLALAEAQLNAYLTGYQYACGLYDGAVQPLPHSQLPLSVNESIAEPDTPSCSWGNLQSSYEVGLLSFNLSNTTACCCLLLLCCRHHGLHPLAPPLLMGACTANTVKFGGTCQLSGGITYSHIRLLHNCLSPFSGTVLCQYILPHKRDSGICGVVVADACVRPETGRGGMLI